MIPISEKYCLCKSSNTECFWGKLINLSRPQRWLLIDVGFKDLLVNKPLTDSEVLEIAHKTKNLLSRRDQQDFFELRRKIPLIRLFKNLSGEDYIRVESWVGIILNNLDGLRIFCEGSVITFLKTSHKIEIHYILLNNKKLNVTQYIKEMSKTTPEFDKSYGINSEAFEFHILNVGSEFCHQSVRMAYVKKLTKKAGFLCYNFMLSDRNTDYIAQAQKICLWYSQA